MRIVPMYHSISDVVSDESMEVSPDTILKHIGWLEELGFKIVPLKKLLCSIQPMQASITFDDGYIDFLKILPMIKEVENLFITLFICCNELGNKNHWSSKNNNMKRVIV